MREGRKVEIQHNNEDSAQMEVNNVITCLLLLKGGMWNSSQDTALSETNIYLFKT